jgi:hypothetical protein
MLLPPEGKWLRAALRVENIAHAITVYKEEGSKHIKLKYAIPKQALA